MPFLHQIPNAITIARILLIPIFAVCYHYAQMGYPYFHTGAIIVFCICAVSDAVDGALARALKAQSFVGTILDPIADKLLLITAVLILNRYQHIPAWLTILIVSRDVMIITGVLTINTVKDSYVAQPSFYGKVTTGLQMTTVVWVLLSFQPSQILFVLTGFFTIVSGLQYLYRGVKEINRVC